MSKRMLDDYGGNAFFRGRRRYKRNTESEISMRCCSCGKLRYVLPNELHRAAKPRCMGCGGPLEEIAVSRKRRGLPKKIKPTNRVKPLRCPGCGAGFVWASFMTAEMHLTAHLRASDECMEAWRQAEARKKEEQSDLV